MIHFNFVGGPFDGRDTVPVGVSVQIATTGGIDNPRFERVTTVDTGDPKMHYVKVELGYEPTKPFEWRERPHHEPPKVQSGEVAADASPTASQ